MRGNSQFYFPLFNFSLRGLYKRRLAGEGLESIPGLSAEDHEEKLISAREINRKKRNMLVYHALLSVVGILVHLPILGWQVGYIKDASLRYKDWLLVTKLGLHGPFVIAGNITMLVHNLHSGLLLSNQKSCASSHMRNTDSGHLDSRQRECSSETVSRDHAVTFDLKHSMA
ncbi:uncharacterized protein MELLADRAFT_77572 [Melampsora larici-populina 98AG31]|uniref:Uncharacterized protein n=1 Tax=Melampsora larici-populina (strain 98AG31 / pathotype 3-4-7) TaxID=747676 RepID=F4RJF3_MELLP|nr:uncharacterized protein MELLADRAFT_77572 [Melampsora larici-populina 98AG31]EGG07302.1 hypothetical protein MELLADRAFT_77572 [Melampsora larici-populina 98AG31]